MKGWVVSKWRMRSVLFHNGLCHIYGGGRWCLKWSTLLAIPFFAGVQVLNCLPRCVRDPEVLRIVLVYYIATKCLLFVVLLAIAQWVKRMAKADVLLTESTGNDIAAEIMPREDSRDFPATNG